MKLSDFLRMPPWLGLKAELANDNWIIRIRLAIDEELRLCPKGHKRRVHDYQTLTVTTAPMGEIPTKIVVEVGRLRCPKCPGDEVRKPIPDILERYKLTRTGLFYIIQQGLMERSFADVARKIGVSEETVSDLVHVAIDKLEARFPVQASDFIGLDEVFIRGRSRAVIVDLRNKHVLMVLDDRNRNTVEAALRSLPGRERVRAVVIDQCGHYRDAIMTALPWVSIVLDRYHLVGYPQKAKSEVVKKYQNKIKDEHKKKKMAAYSNILKAARTKPSKRTGQQVEDLAVLSRHFPELGAVIKLADAFHQIVLKNLSPETAREQLTEWRDSLLDEKYTIHFADKTMRRPFLKPLEKCTGALADWGDEIFNIYAFRQGDQFVTNGYTENRNGFIKNLNRAGRGYSLKVLVAKARVITGAWGLEELAAVCDEIWHGPLPDKIEKPQARKTVKPSRRASKPGKVPMPGQRTFDLAEDDPRRHDNANDNRPEDESSAS